MERLLGSVFVMAGIRRGGSETRPYSHFEIHGNNVETTDFTDLQGLKQ